MAALTPQQAQQLSDALVDAFDPATLPWVVRSSLGPQLYAIVDTGKALQTVVTELLGWMERRGPGALEAFLRGAVSARPKHQLLHDFCEKNFPGTLLALDSGNLVQSFNLGLQLLIDMKNSPTVRQTVGGFRADLETTSRQIRILKQYKVLHDSLHGLQLTLGAIEEVISRSAEDPSVLAGLGKQTIPLTRWAKEARAQTVNLPTKGVEDDWIDDFDTGIQGIKDSSLQPLNREKAVQAAEQLRALLSNGPRINSLLVLAADSLRLESFINTMKAIADNLRGFADPLDKALRLFESSTSVGVLRARVDGLVGEHNDWQFISGQLQAAEVISKHQPQARVPKWLLFKTRLAGLCAAYPETDWSRDLSERLKKWIEDTPSTEPDQDEKTAGNTAFSEFHDACVYRFFDVDKELNELSGQVTAITQPVDTLLATIQ